MTERAADLPESGATPAIEPVIESHSRGNFPLAICAGLGAAAAGAILWALFVYFTEMKLGLIVIAVGALVGLVIRKAGAGSDRRFGILGATCAAIAWALGTIFCDVAFVAKEVQRPFLDVLGNLGASESVSLALNAADGMDLLFLAIAVWEGYRLSLQVRTH